MNLSYTEILLGTPNDIPPIFDLFISVAKMCIYCCKYQNTIPKIANFTARIDSIKQVEKYIAVKNNTTNAFNDKWFITNP